jgi:hypothetical protein
MLAAGYNRCMPKVAAPQVAPVVAAGVALVAVEAAVDEAGGVG